MIKLSTTTRYATRILVFIAMQSDSRPVSRPEIAKAEGVTLDYAEQILIKLKAGNLLQSHRGARGGYTLNVDPESITMADVVRLLEGDFNLAPCLKEHCDRSTACVTSRVWKNAADTLANVLDATTIADLAKEAKEQLEERSLSYVI